MQKADTLIRTKLHLPFTRPGLVLRPRLQEKIAQGLRGPLTLVTAPAGFGKTTLTASGIAAAGLTVAWLSLDKNDNQPGRFLSYLVAALQEADPAVAIEAGRLLSAAQPVSPEAVLTSLINDLATNGRETVLVLDDYQFINSQAVHEELTFLLEHCPKQFHLVIATRSDPPLPLSRLRARGQTVELRAADLRFTGTEAAQFLNDVMGLHLDDRSVAVLAERTEGWVAGLQMAALSMRDRKDVIGFIEGFSGTNRYILDYLLEEVLASQPPEIQSFLLCTSVLERLTAPLCAQVLQMDRLQSGIPGRLSASFQPSTLLNCQPVLEYLERANLFLVPLDDERQWYRYHHLFADLLHARLDQIYPGLAPKLHQRAAAWYEQNGSVLEAIQHASMAPDNEMVEHLIEKNYLQMMNRGEMAGIRFWMGKLSKEWVTRRPWLCLYEAFRSSWFGQLEEASTLLSEAEKHIHAGTSAGVTAPGVQAMQGYHAYVQSRVTAMQGDTQRAIQLCLTARENTPADNLGLQIEIGITLGYEYFLVGDLSNAHQTLEEMIRACHTVGAINNPVAAYALLARSQVLQGRLHDAYDHYQKAAQLLHQSGGQYQGVTGLVEVGIAALLCEWNDLDAALVHLKQGLDLLQMWVKTDDFCLAYLTLNRILLARGNRVEAAVALEKAVQLVQSCGVFSEARNEVQAAQVKQGLAQGDRFALDRWAMALERRFGSPDGFRFEDELAHLSQARVLLAQQKTGEAVHLLSCLEESARSGGRQGRLIESLILKALALQAAREPAQAEHALTQSLALAEPGGYVRVFLDEGQPVQMLLTQGLAHAGSGPLRDYALHLLTQFDSELNAVPTVTEKVSPAGAGSAISKQTLVEPLTPREVEVLQLIALGGTNQAIASQLIVSPGTVKAHTASIYRKLDVANRTEAVARARQLRILS